MSDSIDDLDEPGLQAELDRMNQLIADERVRLRRVSRLYPPDGWGHGYKIRRVIEPWEEYAAKLRARQWMLTSGNAKDVYSAASFSQICSIVEPDFTEVNRELLEHFSHHPDQLQNIEWRAFELLLESVFRNQGFRTELGTGGNDSGVDLRLLTKDSIGQIVTLVQAKRYRGTRPIRLEAVQALAAVVDDEKANRGLLVTTSRFLPSAKRFAQRQRNRLVLATAKDVAKWCDFAARTR